MRFELGTFFTLNFEICLTFFHYFYRRFGSFTNHKVQSSKFQVQSSKKLVSLAYHLMLVHQLLPGRRLQEIEAAILAAAALAAHHGDDVARLADAEGIAGELLYPPDEIFYDYSLEAWIETLVVTLIETLVATLIETLVATLIETLVADRKCHGIGINHYLATIEKIAANPIHYHSVAFF